MRIHNQQADLFVAALAASINKDPSSLEGWLCLHVPQHDDAHYEQVEDVLMRLKARHTDMDCDVVHCTDNDLLLISRALKADALYSLAHEFLADSADIADTPIYDMFYDWRAVHTLLQEKTDASSPAASPNTPYSFNTSASLYEVFVEAKELRKKRDQLWMMVVEDDPLTRRIVSNSFKDHYALITASNAQEAISCYLLHAPDIVFLDIGLPDASGFDVLQHIIAQDADAYVVMFSSNSYLDNVTAALGRGASGFIPKPFKKDKMHYYIMDSALHHATIHASVRE